MSHKILQYRSYLSVIGERAYHLRYTKTKQNKTTGNIHVIRLRKIRCNKI